jgi:RNA polymerase sigma-70 factor (ECF subfamily)
MTDSSAELLKDLQSGEPEAAARIHARYRARLAALARARISPRLGRRIDADDVLQSAWRSFFRHAGDANYRVERGGDLWRLLQAIVRHKLLSNVERHQAARRAIGRESEPVAEDSANLGPQAIAREGTPADEAALAEVWRMAREALSPDERTVFDLRLASHTIDEIAQAMGRSERTIRRWLTQIKLRLAQIVGNTDPDAGIKSDR